MNPSKEDIMKSSKTDIIKTAKAKCRDCYKCVRACPVKAIGIRTIRHT